MEKWDAVLERFRHLGDARPEPESEILKLGGWTEGRRSWQVFFESRSLKWWEVGLNLVAMLAIVMEVIRQCATGIVPLEILVVFLVAFGVAAQRWLPLPAGLAGLAASVLALLTPASTFSIWVAAQVVLFMLALRGTRRHALWVGLTQAGVLYVGNFLVAGKSALDPDSLLLLTWTFAVLGVGLSVKEHRERLEALKKVASAILAARDSEVELHVADELLRIARDLHDSVAHTLAVISVHAGAASKAIPERPADAQKSLAQVRAASHTALTEIQQILRLLRTVRDSGDAAGNDSLRRVGIEELVDAVATAGLVIHAELPEARILEELGGPVTSALSRIVQELLTNAQKHGNGPVELAITLDSRMIYVKAGNRVTRSAPADRAGFGLIGMRERVAALGGDFHVDRNGAHFVVEIALPHLQQGSSRAVNNATGKVDE